MGAGKMERRQLGGIGNWKRARICQQGAGGPIKHGTPPPWRHREKEKSKNLPARVPAFLLKQLPHITACS